MNTPNKITLSRLILIPLVVFFYLADFIPYTKLIATIIFAVACLTDFLDGYLARKNNQVTTLGKFFDSIADKVLTMTGFILIICPTRETMPAVLPIELGISCVIVILAREFIISALRQIAAAKGKVLAADMGGKIKATAQFLVLIFYMFFAFLRQENIIQGSSLAYNIIHYVLMVLLVLTTVLTIYSGCSYLIRNRHVFKEENAEIKPVEKENIQLTNAEGKQVETRDPLFFEAAKFIIETQQPSTTAVQRQFSIGYPRAALLIDKMEEMNIISEVGEENKRTVLMTKEEFDKICENK